MKTIILFWNPTISNVSVTSFRMGMKDFGGGGFSWEVHSHDRVEVGDLCYLVRCDSPSGGIVLRGIVSSPAGRGAHWYKENAHTWYAEIAVTHVLNPVTAPLITVERLQREIPGFRWDGGPSGRVLRSGWARRLETIWEDHLAAHPDLFKNKMGVDFSKQINETQLDATLFCSPSTSVCLYIYPDEACIASNVNLDIDDDLESKEIVTLDGREQMRDLTFKLKDAYRAFDVDNRFDLYRIIVERFSDREALKLMTDYLYDHGVKFELEEFNDWLDEDEPDED